jgi:hypothetical protein
MVEFGSRERARELADQINDALKFAEEHEDHVLAAKLADAHFYLISHYIEPTQKGSPTT